MQTVERRFQFLADAAPVMIWMSGPDMGCTWFNKPWLEFVGRSMDEEIGDGWSQNVHNEDLDRCLATYTTAFGDRRPFSMEYRLRRHDGEYRWLLDNGIPLFEADEEFTGYIGSCIDITERREGEESLRREHELSENIINTISDIVLVLDTAGRIVRFNPFMERLTGWRLADVRGRDWFATFLPGRDRIRIRELFRSALDGKRVRANVNPILTKA